MGTSSKDVTTWHNGTSSYGPTEFQDDMGIIARSVNGFGYRQMIMATRRPPRRR